MNKLYNLDKALSSRGANVLAPITHPKAVPKNTNSRNSPLFQSRFAPNTPAISAQPNTISPKIFMRRVKCVRTKRIETHIPTKTKAKKIKNCPLMSFI